MPYRIKEGGVTTFATPLIHFFLYALHENNKSAFELIFCLELH